MTSRNGGKWTEARFNSFVKSALRAASRRWPPKYEALANACVGTKVNAKTGRLAKHYLCAECNREHPGSNVQVDHTNPIIDPEEGFVSWDSVVSNMFCEASNLAVMCKECHAGKTKTERTAAAAARKRRKTDGRG